MEICGILGVFWEIFGMLVRHDEFLGVIRSMEGAFGESYGRRL